jgi:hypothetical protein
MIVAITQYKLDDSIDANRARELSAASVDKFRDLTGLHRKYFMLTEDATNGASVYLWESKRFAEEFFTEEWMQRIEGKYGHRPTVTYFDCSIVVDNVSHEVLNTDDPA